LSNNSAAVRRAEAKLKAQGWRRKHFWLSPECVEVLDDLMRATGATDASWIIKKIIIDAARNLK